MRQSKFSRFQIVEILRKMDIPGTEVKQVCREHGISEATIYRWRKAYGGLSGSQAPELRQLKAENARLRKLMVDRDLQLEVAQELLKKS